MNVQCVLVSVLLITAVKCVQFIGCPENLTAYLGCNKTVTAILNLSSAESFNCFDYRTVVQLVNINKEYSPSPVTIPETLLCSISITFPIVKFFYDVLFIAVGVRTFTNEHKNCTDLITVHDSVPPPTISNITVNCTGSLIEWIAPELEDGSAVNQYKLQINGPNITYHTRNATSMLVPYDSLLYNEEYTISICALYCGRGGNQTFGTIRTATVPQVIDDSILIMEIKNLTHAIISVITKVITVGCPVSYPMTVAIEISCDLEGILVDDKEVNVTDGGTIVVGLELHVDKHCLGTLVWKNRYFSSNERSVNFDTNQLQSCRFSVDEGEVSFSCVYANGSTLQGCMVIATHSSNKHQYTNKSRAGDRERGIISGLRDGVYNVTCGGALGPTSVVRYSGARYSTVLSVAGVSDCNKSSWTSSSLTTFRFISVTPSETLIDNGKNSHRIIIIAVVVSIVLLVLLIVIPLILIGIFWCLNKSKLTMGNLAIEIELKKE